MADHYLLSDRKLAFTAAKPSPKDRSIFRENIGRALLHRAGDPYEPVWEIDFTSKVARETGGHLRDVEKERTIEREVTQILRERFSFSWIELDGQDRRMGAAGLEARLIGSLSACTRCQPSPSWLGRLSPKPKITASGLWLEQYLGAPELTGELIEDLCRHIEMSG